MRLQDFKIQYFMIILGDGKFSRDHHLLKNICYLKRIDCVVMSNHFCVSRYLVPRSPLSVMLRGINHTTDNKSRLYITFTPYNSEPPAVAVRGAGEGRVRHARSRPDRRLQIGGYDIMDGSDRPINLDHPEARAAQVAV
ncbi:hypothetical protein J6590_000207 [Homalodisca vitripennis]|nr:hypothetical protein J6590_000207 [Homalodisca vitripennis]